MLAFGVADVGRAAVWLHPQQFFEIDRLPFASSFAARFLASCICTNCDDGIPQRAIINSRTPSGAFRTIGAMVSGNMPGSGGRLPVVSRSARVNAMIAAWPLVRL